jgi:hypothetical protein
VGGCGTCFHPWACPYGHSGRMAHLPFRRAGGCQVIGDRVGNVRWLLLLTLIGIRNVNLMVTLNRSPHRSGRRPWSARQGVAAEPLQRMAHGRIPHG